ncbi:MAG: hypothetical protein AAGF26_05345 [Cyanobacteria bacterium P01_G01_bin.49]
MRIITSLFQARSPSDEGMTLSELLMGTIVGLIVINLAFMGFSWNRQIYLRDQQTNSVNQTLRTVFEIVGADIRQAGEGFAEDPNFPSIEITYNSVTENSEVSIRRSLLSVSLPVCGAIRGGSTDPVVVADNAVAGCSVIDEDNNGTGNGWPDTLDIWRNYRLSNGSTVRAYIFDGLGDGEFFTYSGESVTPTTGTVTSASINANGQTWQNSYGNTGSSRIYLIEERRYRLNTNDNTLELIIDDDNSQISKVVGGLEKFEVIANIEQNLSGTSTPYTCNVIPPVDATSCNTTLPNTYVWSQIRSIELQPRVLIPDAIADAAWFREIPEEQLEQSQKVFPRNILNY